MYKGYLGHFVSPYPGIIRAAMADHFAHATDGGDNLISLKMTITQKTCKSAHGYILLFLRQNHQATQFSASKGGKGLKNVVIRNLTW